MNGWTEEFPEVSGQYWFCGWTSDMQRRDHPDEPRLRHVFAHTISNGMMYVADGQFLYEKEAFGVWLPCEVPHLPHVSTLTEMSNEVCCCNYSQLKDGCSCPAGE